MKRFFLLLWVVFVVGDDPELPGMGSVVIGSHIICPQFLCKSSVIKSGCATYANEDIIMEKCLDDWYCDWSESSSRNYEYGKCILKRRHFKFRKDIGEFCYQNEDCKSYYCSSNKCSVIKESNVCENSYQCDKGLLCDPELSTCQKWLANDASCSNKPTMCNPQSGCVQVDGSLPVCTKYFSLGINYFNVINSGLYHADSSFFCESASRATNENKCLQEALKLSGGYPQTCSDLTTCSTTQDANAHSSCLCYPNTEGVKYCQPFPGDIPDTMTLIKEKANQDFSRCYNFEIFSNINDCGYFSMEEHREWAPQIQANTWGSCYDSVNMSVGTQVSMQYTVSSTGSCPAIKCLQSGNNPKGYCFSYLENSNIYYVQTCPNDYLCGSLQNGDYSLMNSDVLCKEVRPKRNRHKDESCWVDNDCFSGMCGIDKYCTVYTEGSTCTSDNQCDRQLVCKPTSLTSSSYTCQKWLELGEVCSTDNYYLCRPYSICASSSSTDTGKCQAYYSVEGGNGYYQIISNGPEKGTSDKMCKSGSYNSAVDACFTSPDKLSTFPTKCTEDIECRSTNYESLGITGSDGNCACIPNTQGYKYCSPFFADIDDGYYDWLHNYYSRDLNNCFSYEIGAAYGGSCELGKRYYDIWSRIIENDYFPSCARDVLFDENRYEDTLENDLIYLYVFSSRMAVFIAVLLGVLLIQ